MAKKFPVPKPVPNNIKGAKVPGGGMVDMRSPVMKRSIPTGVGFGSGHEGVRRGGGPHPAAPKNG